MKLSNSARGRGRRRSAALLATGALMVGGCGGGEDSSSSGTDSAKAAGGAQSDTVSGNVTVFAAASLRESFTSLEKTFEKEHPDADVVLSFGPSSGLATQITQGAPADVFASAAPKNMETVTSAGSADTSRTFARNRMAIVTPVQNPGKITSLKDLAKPDVKTAVCQAQVPCGAVAARVFDKAALNVKPATEEVDVKAVLTKVQLGEVDAGMVYATDAQAAGSKVKTINLGDAQNASTDYPITTLSNAPNAAGAAAWLDLVFSKRGQDVLAKAGFAPPA